MDSLDSQNMDLDDVDLGHGSLPNGSSSVVLFVTRSLQRRKAVKRHPVCNTLDLIPPPSLSCSNNNVYVFVAKSLTPSLPFSSALPYVIMF